jgi:hypothetical protein
MSEMSEEFNATEPQQPITTTILLLLPLQPVSTIKPPEMNENLLLAPPLPLSSLKRSAQ